MKNKFIIPFNINAKKALKKLNNTTPFFTLFVLNKNKVLIGSLTDGDIRRGLLKGLSLEEPVLKYINYNFKYLEHNNELHTAFNLLKEEDIKLIPIVDKNKRIFKIIESDRFKSLLPLDVVIMAGGIGKRLMPLTKNTPKPLLEIGNKTIIEHNLDLLNTYGINNIYITLHYLSDKIISRLRKNKAGYNLNFIIEKKPMGTLGGINLIKKFTNDYIMLMNADLLTNVDFEDFFNDFVLNNADFSILTVPYRVSIPYAIIEKDNKGNATSLKEKPIYTYLANGGIYLFKKTTLKFLKKDKKIDTTDLINDLIENNKKIITYSNTKYWLDIGSIEDFYKAQDDIKHIDLN